jgi:hypothetical protein
MASAAELVVLFRKYTGLVQSYGDDMSYSILKMIEFTLDYILRNELREDVDIPEGAEAKQAIISFMTRRIAEIKKATK